MFDVKGFIEGREYYPNGQVRFEGKYMICSGYGPNYPMYGRTYDENGQQVFSGKFTVEHTGVGYPRIKKFKRLHDFSGKSSQVQMVDVE